jgi:hypothetical protein
MGTFMHAVEDEMLCSSLMPDKVPYFNAPIYLQNKSQIGKVDEILGPINEVRLRPCLLLGVLCGLKVFDRSTICFLGLFFHKNGARHGGEQLQKG